MPEPEDLHEGSFIPENGAGSSGTSSSIFPPKEDDKGQKPSGDDVHDSAVPVFGSSSSNIAAAVFVPLDVVDTGTPESSTSNSAVAVAAFEPLPGEDDESDPVLVAADQNAARMAASASSNELVFGGFKPASPPAAAAGAAHAPTAGTAQLADQTAAKPFNITLILLTWASLATLIAFWLWYTRPEEPSPLESIPDDGILSRADIISPLERLSQRQMFDIGQTKQIGALEITPLSIENRRVRILPDMAGADSKFLVLHLKIKNVSESQSIRPMDPVFLYFHPRGAKGGPRRLKGLDVFDASGYTYTFIHPSDDVAKLSLPFDLIYEGDQYRVEGQNFPMLHPGQSTEVIVISAEDAYNSLTGDMVWRIKLRKQKVGDRGVATVIGVRFNKNDIKT